MEQITKSSKLHPSGYYDFYAKDLDAANKLGYFAGNMSVDEFSRRVNIFNDDCIGFRVRSHFVAMFHKNRPGRPFIAGLETGTLPKYNIYNEDGTKLLARGWYHLAKILEGRKLKFDWRGL